jgi:hypothetical protein
VRAATPASRAERFDNIGWPFPQSRELYSVDRRARRCRYPSTSVPPPVNQGALARLHNSDRLIDRQAGHPSSVREARAIAYAPATPKCGPSTKILLRPLTLVSGYRGALDEPRLRLVEMQLAGAHNQPVRKVGRLLDFQL